MDKNHKKRNLVKAVTVLLGAITILGLVGYLIFNMFTENHAPPSLTVRTSYDSITKVHRVEVENTGDTTAEEVVIRCQIIRGDRVIDTIAITMQYLPTKSKKSANVAVPSNEGLSVDIQVISIHYQTP